MLLYHFPYGGGALCFRADRATMPASGGWVQGGGNDSIATIRGTFDAGDVVEEGDGVESMQSALAVTLVLRDGVPAKVLQKYREGRARCTCRQGRRCTCGKL